MEEGKEEFKKETLLVRAKARFKDADPVSTPIFQTAAFRSLSTDEVIRMRVDTSLELARIDLRTLHALPPLLRHVPALGCVRGVVSIDDELCFLIDPHEIQEL